MEAVGRIAALGLFLTACGPLVALDGDTEGHTGDSSGDERTEGDDDRPPTPEGDDGIPPGSDVDDGGDDAPSDDTGVGSRCGDGIVDPGEICDDGNDEPGDGCELDCTSTPGQLLWSQTVDATARGDTARAVTVDGAGQIYVTGALSFDGNADVWLEVFAPDGTSHAEYLFDFGDDEIGTAVAIGPDGRAFVAGVQPDSDGALLLRLDGEALVPIEPVPTDIIGFGALLAPTSTGLTLVTHSFGDGLLATMSLRDADGAPLLDVPLPPDIFVGAAVPTPAGGLWLAGSQRLEQDSQTAWLAETFSDGAIVWTYTGDALPGVESRLRSVAMLSDGRLVAVGSRGMGGPNDDEQGWAWWFTIDGALESDGPLDIGGASARPSSVVPGAHGFLVGGTIPALDDGFVAGIGLDGAVQWGWELTGERGFEDEIAALAVVPGWGVAAVGTITQGETQEDAWVGLFSD